MIRFLRRLFAPKPPRHHVRYDSSWGPAVCSCAYSSNWDYDLRKHFEETGRVGK